MLEFFWASSVLCLKNNKCDKKLSKSEENQSYLWYIQKPQKQFLYETRQKYSGKKYTNLSL